MEWCNKFMGLCGIENGVIWFYCVRVFKDNLIGREGDGLKIVLIIFNVGWLFLLVIVIGVVK